MNKKLKLILCLLTAMCLVLVFYIAFHELGHMIVMLSAGATIDDFSIIGLIPIGSLFAWVFIPFLFLSDIAPVNDDVTKFLFNFSQTNNPLIVSAAAAFLIGIGVVLMTKKGVLKNYIFEIKELRKNE